MVRGLVAVQAQDYAGARWAVGQRTMGTTETEVDRAFDAGELLRTHVLRPTWHLVAPEDLRWLLALTGPRILRGTAARSRFLEIDPALATRAAGVFERAITREGPRTRPELAQALHDAGIVADGGRLTHLVMQAELAAIICSGPRRGRTHTYALVDERVPSSGSRPRDEALADLALRYIRGHGPAQAGDLAWWAGLSIGDARLGLEAATRELRRETVGSRTFWLSAEHGDGRHVASPVVHLLPNYDELLVAFQDRRDAVHPALPANVRVAGGIFDHVIARDGIVIGSWRRADSAGTSRIALTTVATLDGEDRLALDAAFRRLSSFLARPVSASGLD